MVRPLRLFDVALRTAYAQAKELAVAQSQVALTTPGNLQIEKRGKGNFVYRYRYDAQGQRITDYLGVEGDDATVAKVTEAENEIRDARMLAESSRDLRRVGYYSVGNSTLVTLATIFNAGIFKGGGVLVGTHAFGAILNELGVRCDPLPMTEDIDLARAQRIEIAALPRGGFLSLLRSSGLAFHEVPRLRLKDPPTSFKVRGKKLKVDLLIPAAGKPYEPVAVPELGAHATGLPHFRYLLKNATGSILLARDRIVPVTVPDAGRYCIHKLALFSMRTGSDNPKRSKDVAQAALLAAAMSANHEFLLSDAIDGMNRALRKEVKSGARQAALLLRPHHRDAADQLESLG